MDYNETCIRYCFYKMLREEGMTLQAIGELYGISRQAVRERLWKGLPKEFCGIVKPRNKFWEGKPYWLRKGRERVRELVRARDGYKCQGCGILWSEGARRLDVHHIKGLCGKKSRGYDAISDMDTLLTLCHRCHFGRHDFSQRIK